MNKPYFSKFDFAKYRRSTANYIEHTPLLTEENVTAQEADSVESSHNMERWMIILGGFIGLLVAFALTSQMQLSLIKVAVLVAIPSATAYILRKVYLHTLSQLNE